MLVADGDLRAYLASCLDDCIELKTGALSAKGAQSLARLWKRHSPSLTIADITLAGDSAIRQHLAVSPAPVLLISELNTQPDQVIAPEAGVRARLAVPFNAGRLRSAVESLLNRVSPPPAVPGTVEDLASAARLPLKAPRWPENVIPSPFAAQFGLYQIGVRSLRKPPVLTPGGPSSQIDPSRPAASIGSDNPDGTSLKPLADHPGSGVPRFKNREFR